VTNLSHLSQYPSLTALLSERLARTPHAIAVESEGQRLTYADLDRRSNQLARTLQTHGIGRNVLVGVIAERSIHVIVSLLGVLKAGGAYVPLDPKHGLTRIQQILDESRIQVVVGPSGSREIIESGMTFIEPTSVASSNVRDEPLACQLVPSDLAYIIFTSGSTGKPKGVEIEHRSLLNFFASMLQEPGFDVSDTLLSVTTLAFDIAGLEMYLPLIASGRLVIAGGEAVNDGAQLVRLLEASGATVMQATPATWRLLYASGWQGDRRLKVLVGGEALSVELARQLYRSCGEVWNMYGPTETTIWSSIYKLNGAEERNVPIGHPIASTALHILNEHFQPVEGTQEGELYIGGDGLARGYLHRPDLTEERFLRDPFSPQPGARLYRTGDVVRRRIDGDFEFLGRVDHQVKIRGFRIELGEIESVLERHKDLRQAVAVAREEREGEKYIAAYVKVDPAKARSAAVSGLRGWAAEKLPEYMVPAAFVALDEFPLTQNGKVDRNALPAPKSSDFTSCHEYVAPRDETERKLVAMWEKELGITPIGITTSFFDLGGQSLQAARLFVKMGRVFGADLPLSTLFRAPTIEMLARKLRPGAALGEAYCTITPIQPLGSKPPFFCVHGGAGSTLFLRSLAKALGSERSFYGIEPEGMDGRPFVRPSIEEMASHYIAEIRRIQPSGPYLIGGYCFGGIVAVEMAQQLRRDGEVLGIVALFSAPLRFNRPRPLSAPVSRSAAARLKRILGSPGKVATRRWRSAKVSAQMGMCRAFTNLGKPVPQMLRTTYVDQMLRRAEWKYVPKSYPGSLHLFRGCGLYDNDPQMGWGGLADELYDHIIGRAVTHRRREIMTEPLVSELARELRCALQNADSNHIGDLGKKKALLVATQN
jgi:amino acid adenylation domain-containing protein